MSFCFLQVLIDHFVRASLIQKMSLNLEKLILLTSKLGLLNTSVCSDVLPSRYRLHPDMMETLYELMQVNIEPIRVCCMFWKIKAFQKKKSLESVDN